MLMEQLLYVSNTSRDISSAALEDILKSAQRNNAQLDVTGMLLYADGGFLQVLEGETQTLDALYAKIAQDKRHWNTQVLLRHKAPRAFADWSMGFARLSPSDD